MTWRKHHGGANPYAYMAPEQMPTVRVGFRCRRVSRDVHRADKWRWQYGAPFPVDSEFDIVSYREEAA